MKVTKSGSRRKVMLFILKHSLPVHEIYDEDGDVTEGRSSITQVGEGLVAWCVDDEQTGDADIEGG